MQGTPLVVSASRESEAALNEQSTRSGRAAPCCRRAPPRLPLPSKASKLHDGPEAPGLAQRGSRAAAAIEPRGAHMSSRDDDPAPTNAGDAEFLRRVVLGVLVAGALVALAVVVWQLVDV